MSNFECDLVADLLPRYIDKTCTKETMKFINEHIRSCDDCRELFEAMNSEIIGVTTNTPRRRHFRLSGGIKVLLIVLGYLGIVVIGLIIFSYILINGVL